MRVNKALVASLVILCLALLPTTVPAMAAVDEGGAASDNVEWIRNVPLAEGFAEGGRYLDGYFYVTVNGQGLLIFDVSTPEDPQLVGRLVAPHLWENEDVATNGKIALISQGDQVTYNTGPTTATSLSVVDVEDKTNPHVIATIPAADDHTYECLYKCNWAYGSFSGSIIDLKDPKHPKMLEEHWLDVLTPGTRVHDVTEVRPGLVLTSGVPMYLLDVSKSVVKPKVLAYSELSIHSGHNVMWPRSGEDSMILTATERVNPRCEYADANDSHAAFETWNTKGWRKTRTFQPIDEWEAENGTYVDGQPAISGWYGCSAHWFEPHPDFNNGGEVAVGFYGHGVRFLDVSSDGSIEENGYFLGWGANTSAAYWITDEIVYTVDMQRGIDVLKVDL